MEVSKRGNEMTHDEKIEWRGFQNGWRAHSEVDYVPECFFNSDADKSPLEMFAQQKNTCTKGHHTFECNPKDIKTCRPCQRLLKRGRWKS